MIKKLLSLALACTLVTLSVQGSDFTYPQKKAQEKDILLERRMLFQSIADNENTLRRLYDEAETQRYIIDMYEKQAPSETDQLSLNYAVLASIRSHIEQLNSDNNAYRDRIEKGYEITHPTNMSDLYRA